MKIFKQGELIKAFEINDNFNELKNNINELQVLIEETKKTSFPIGGILAWATSINFPNFGTHWLDCDGKTFDTNKYPDLYSVLGANKLPDYRGLFLRRIWKSNE